MNFTAKRIFDAVYGLCKNGVDLTFFKGKVTVCHFAATEPEVFAVA